MQPQFRQMPPRCSRSTTAVLKPSCAARIAVDRKSTRLNSSHANISYAVFCLKKKKNKTSTIDAPLPSSESQRIAKQCICRTITHPLHYVSSVQATVEYLLLLSISHITSRY